MNVNEPERLASLMGGGALIAWGMKQRSLAGWLTAAAGGALAYRGATGHCPMYRALGINTTNRSGRNVSIPYELGIRVDYSITIDKAPEELYTFWRNLENLPKFMKHLECVKEIDNKTSHWVAKGPAGANIQWKAEIINEVENEMIGWRSLPGADVPNAGSVHFTPDPGGRGTRITVALQYNPPAGTVGALVARLLGKDPEQQIAGDMRRFKQLMETGEVSTTEGQSAGRRDLARDASRRPPPRKGWNRDVVGQASEDSFPASDPPSWTPTAGPVVDSGQ